MIFQRIIRTASTYSFQMEKRPKSETKKYILKQLQALIIFHSNQNSVLRTNFFLFPLKINLDFNLKYNLVFPLKYRI